MTDSLPEDAPAALPLDRARLADAILSSSLDCIVVADDQGRIVEFNQAAEATFGWTRAQVLNRPMDDTIVPHHHRQGHRHGMARYLATGVRHVIGRRVEVEGLHADGRVFPVELSITETEVDGARHFVATLRDISDSKRVALDLQQARASLQAIFDSIPAALYLRDRDDRLVMMNAWGGRFLGQDPAAMVGQPMSRYREPQNVEGVRKADAEILRTGRAVTQEFAYHLPGGDRTGLMTFFPVFDGGGEISHIGGMLLDVTDHYRARSDLDEVQALLKSIFDNVPALLYMRELDGSFVMVNKWGANFFGKTPEQMVGELAQAFDKGDDIELAKLAQKQLLQTGRPVTQNYRFTLDDREVKMLNTIFPIHDRHGAIVRIGGITTDVTELHDARSRLQEVQENLHQSEKLAALGQLLAGVAHELNNPLAVVLGRAALLQEKLAETPHAASLQKLRDAATRCARIVKTFLAMARQTGPRREAIEINDLVEMALEMTTYGLRGADITWNWQPMAGARRIEVDHDQLVQVLINLILNAQYALDSHDGLRRIDIRAEPSRDGRWTDILVADTGPGVAEAIAHRIFDPFFTTKALGEGTGLGLSVCKSMVEAHGGTLTLEPTPGGGATFRVRLPAQIAEPGAAPAEPAVTAASSRGRFLIVEDEDEIAALLVDCMTPLGIDCVTAGNGRIGLQRIAEGHFDGVFCDVSMPVMDGLAFYEALSASNPGLAARLVFVSGNVLHRDWDRLKSTLDRPIVEKPFDPQQIRTIAQELLSPEGGPP